jgi:diaminopimelate decarboxylase
VTSLFPDPGDLVEPGEPVDPTAPIDLRLFPESARADRLGALTVAGVDVAQLCAELGTPVFVYDEAQLRRRCGEALAAWGPAVAYASKAFLCRAMAALVAAEGLCIDVATGGELHVALAGGVPPERIVVHGNNKSDGELEGALRAGVGRIVVDSFDEIERLERLAPRFGRRPPVLIRVTPGIEAHTHEFVRTGQDDSKFGFGMASGDAQAAIERLRRPNSPLALVGIHFHIGSQIFAVESFAEAIALVAPFFEQLGLEELCVGGGLGVPYVAGETSPTIGEWAATVRAACAVAGMSAEVRLSAEPGRSIGAAAAVTCYTVGTIKKIPGLRTYVSVDGGMSDNPRPVLYGSGYEAGLVRHIGAARPFVAHLVGKHCESGDVIVRNAHLPADLAVGDLVVTPVTGAYGHSMASVYNKVPRPPVVFAADGAWRVVVRRETFADLLVLDL